ncbi:MAG: phage tail sheath C-terminal domain-containing protein [Methylococcaceae bacterium]
MAATAYKTPGVYVEEIPKFPPSIAAVETAIPAFIGYTEKALKKNESLLDKPTRIESIAEFEEMFGGAPPQKMEVYLDNNDAYVDAKKEQGFLLYDSLRLFYANGGGNAYIVSVGSYDDTIAKDKLIEGIKKLEIEDEPTILLFPDAVSLTGLTDLYDVQVEALTQCNKLQDRVTVCDVINTDKDFGVNVQALRNGIGINYLKYGAAYGPWINSSLPRFVYHRDLTIKRGDTNGENVKLNSLTTDKAILQILNDVKKAEEAVDLLKDAESKFPGSAADKKWQDILKLKSDAYNALKPSQGDITAYEVALKGIYDLLATILADVKIMVEGLPDIHSSKDAVPTGKTKDFILKTDIDQYLASSQLKKVFDVLAAHYNYLRKDDNGKTFIFSDGLTSDLVKGIPLLGYANFANFQTISDVSIENAYNATALNALVTAKVKADKAKVKAVAANIQVPDAATVVSAAADVLTAAELVLTVDKNLTTAITAKKRAADAKAKAEDAAVENPQVTANIKAAADEVAATAIDVQSAAAEALAGAAKAAADLAKNAAMKASDSIIALFRFAQNSAAEYEKKFNEGLLNSFGAYKNIVSKAAEALNLLPPSGAIAGVYAAVDRDRGVWKAPANVSLNAVISPAVKISHEQQGGYNVDVNAGKSINIIRSFTGKGTLVWGARTLAGNDNEWRYISVRRFFNFVEESVKKATEQFVFEPNDANTWVKIQAMIENFLTTLWRQGALQGIKPEHAFYVAVGLGKTMTPLDILEGRMIIEIGMAAVRPAEFIILKFSHKMAES